MPTKKATATTAKQQCYRQNLTGIKKEETDIKNKIRSRKNNKKRTEKAKVSWDKKTAKQQEKILAAIDKEFEDLLAEELAEAKEKHEKEQAKAPAPIPPPPPLKS